MKAVVMNRAGGPEVIAYIERPDKQPGPGMVLVKVAAAGVNFMDIGVRQGSLWAEENNPKVMDVEGAGAVVAVGEGVSRFNRATGQAAADPLTGRAGLSPREPFAFHARPASAANLERP
ncbi:alcohol dehydrogenase catalytic domain-containing protein [Shinella sp. S4-D37]|uniref:alcohol dehydrogenase catalytic domain-containing protein n=1 Tax=Shinella sp. S4-D37 TaxID=3161999 RepID=UPI003465681F